MEATDMTEDEFVAYFCGKSRRLKNNNLPYGLKYINLITTVEENARKIFNRGIKNKLKHK